LAISSGLFGVVEDRIDPLKLGRLRVRVRGYHSPDLQDISTEQLYWATVMQPTSSSFLGGIGVSPTGIVEGTTVVGFFMDGHNAQTPVIIGTLGGNSAKPKSGEGFYDPNQIYTRHDADEADTSRLARNEKIETTPVQWRKDIREQTITKAFGGSWSEPETPYNAQYPYNHVRETEPLPGTDVSGSNAPENYGHIEEFDDTPGAERIYLQHKKGTFTELHTDGSEVHKVIKDRHDIVQENAHLYIKQNQIVTVDGNSHILVKGDAFVEVLGNKRERVHGNSYLEVYGSYYVNVNGAHRDVAGPIRTIEAGHIYLN
jgi:hypothetical protein